MAKKKIKIKLLNDVEISAPNAEAFIPVIYGLETARDYERINKHLAVSEHYDRLVKFIKQELERQENE